MKSPLAFTILVCILGTVSCAKPTPPSGTATFVCYLGKNLSELQDGIVAAQLDTEGTSHWTLTDTAGNTRTHTQPDGESCWVELTL